MTSATASASISISIAMHEKPIAGSQGWRAGVTNGWEHPFAQKDGQRIDGDLASADATIHGAKILLNLREARCDQ